MGRGGADQNFKRKIINLNWNFPMRGKIGGKPFKCQSSMFTGTLPRNRVQVCSFPWVSPFPSLRGTLGKRSSLTSPNIRKLGKKSQNTADSSAVTLRHRLQLLSFEDKFNFILDPSSYYQNFVNILELTMDQGTFK